MERKSRVYTNMCRLLGVAANTTVHLTFSLLLAPNSLRKQARSNSHGWGIAAYRRRWKLWKEAYSAGESREFERRSHEANGKMIISHVRRVTVGKKLVENTHPFQHHGWVLAHNGTVRKSRQIPVAAAFQPRGDTDSERILCALLSEIHLLRGSTAKVSPATVRKALQKVIASCVRLDPICRVNLLFSDGRYLYAFRHGHPLHWLFRGPRASRAVHSRTLRVREDRIAKNEKAVVVATQKLTNEAWKEIASDVLFYVDPSKLAARNALRTAGGINIE